MTEDHLAEEAHRFSGISTTGSQDGEVVASVNEADLTHVESLADPFIGTAVISTHAAGRVEGDLERVTAERDALRQRVAELERALAALD